MKQQDWADASRSCAGVTVPQSYLEVTGEIICGALQQTLSVRKYSFAAPQNVI